MLFNLIWEVLGSNLSQLFCLKFLWLSSVLSGKCWDGTLIRPWPHPSKSFPIHLSSYYPTLYSLNTAKTLLNNPWGTK
jgi:hypothetical protein